MVLKWTSVHVSRDVLGSMMMMMMMMMNADHSGVLSSSKIHIDVEKDINITEID